MDRKKSTRAHDGELDETMESLREAIGGMPRDMTARLIAGVVGTRDGRQKGSGAPAKR
ncbi:hypothetical protein [Sphaerisporangium album]|uniref:hypothetical protein n=1 Tax=Sphaerisporangium album TaxID=509200 RepID=UPI0015F0B1AB|nr:hypothetical protein [Sphaerisporangium album]